MSRSFGRDITLQLYDYVKHVIMLHLILDDFLDDFKIEVLGIAVHGQEFWSC